MNLAVFSVNIKSTTQQKVASLLEYKSSMLFYSTMDSSVRHHNTILQLGWQFLRSIFQKKPTFYLVLLSGLLISLPTESSFALEVNGVPQQTFIATAYYSPLPNQTKYYLGNYAADLRLNGGGTHSADGIPVYAGMIAAPSGYAFGTKIALDGLGVVSVHDRGGAIVKAEDGSHAYDRIDIWMGEGDAGLERTIAWGRREILGSIVSQDTPVSLELETIIERAPRSIDIATKKLALLGYTTENTPIEKAIERFQLDYKVIASTQDPGTGNYGPKTQAALASAYENYTKNNVKPAPATDTTINVVATDTTLDLIARHDAVVTTSENASQGDVSQEVKNRAMSMKTAMMGSQTEEVKNLQNFLTTK